MSATIDFEAIRAAVSLRQVIEADLGQPLRRGRWACPIHQGDDPNFGITPDGLHWKCWSCDETGDVFDWLVRREGITIAQAALRLDPSLDPWLMRVTKGKVPKPVLKPVGPSPAWCDPAWQSTVDGIVCRAESALWSPEGSAALQWLRSRGLTDHTIERFRLGFVPVDRYTAPLEVLGTNAEGKPRSISVRRGITFPWLRPESWYTTFGVDPDCRWVGCNVRRLAVDPFASLPEGQSKCQALTGSVRGYLYPWPTVEPVGDAMPALIVEGEIDALLGWQEVGHLVHAGTVGGSGQTPDGSALIALARCPWWFLAFDHDQPGVKAARTWKDRAPHKTRRLMLPHGKDLGDFVMQGGNVREWLECNPNGVLNPPSPKEHDRCP